MPSQRWGRQTSERVPTPVGRWAGLTDYGPSRQGGWNIPNRGNRANGPYTPGGPPVKRKRKKKSEYAGMTEAQKLELQEEKIKKHQHHCDICNVTVSGADNYDAHLKGKLHKACVEHGAEKGKEAMREELFKKRKEKRDAAIANGELEEINEEDEKKKVTKHECEICKTFVTGDDNWERHLAGKKHKKVLQRQALLESNPVVKTEAVSEAARNRALLKFQCPFCPQRLNSQFQLDSHKNSKNCVKNQNNPAKVQVKLEDGGKLGNPNPKAASKKKKRNNRNYKRGNPAGYWDGPQGQWRKDLGRAGRGGRWNDTSSGRSSPFGATRSEPPQVQLLQVQLERLKAELKMAQICSRDCKCGAMDRMAAAAAAPRWT